MPDSNATPYRRRGRGLFYLLLIALLAAGGWWYVQHGRNADDSGPGNAMRGMRGGFGGPTPVRVATVKTRHMAHTLRAIGTVTAFNTVTVRSRVEGELQSVLFDDGAFVEQGDLLARIDPRSYQVQLDQAQGQLAQTQAQLKNARQDLQRYQTLFAQKSIARQQLDAQAAQVEQLQATVTSNQAAVDNARLQLGYTEITAPLSGRLGLRQVDAGNLVSAGSADGLVTITQTQPISVQFSLPQADLPAVRSALRSGRALTVDILASDDTTLLETGKLAAVDNQIDTATGTLQAKATVANQDEALFPNQFVNVQLHVDAADALAVPTSAVQYGSIGAFVYTVGQDNTVHIQEVVPGQIDGRYIAIGAGLSDGDRVVTEGVDRLREGAAVEIVTDEPGPEPDPDTADVGALSM